MRRILLGCILVLMPLFGLAQPITLSGRVVDSNSGQPLPFANITIRGAAIGTVSNMTGEFDFHFPALYRDDTLAVSYLGYGSFNASVTVLEGVHPLVIRLKPAPLLLREVMVEAENLTGKEIIGKAIAAIENNYPVTPYCIRGFFREIEEENGKYVLLTEAAIDIFDKGYGRKTPRGLRESVRLQEGRQSRRYSSRKNKDNPGYALADLLENDDVKYQRGMLDTSRNTYALDSILTSGEHTVYAIQVRNEIDSGYLYIDTESYAFLSVSMERKSRKPGVRYYQLFEGDSLDIGRVWFRFTVSFRPYQGRLYAYRTHESELNEFHDPATKTVKIASVETLEFIATEILPGVRPQGAVNLNYRTRLDIGDYHEAFWESYNVLKLTPLNERLIRDLEQGVSLKEQFRQKK